MTTFERLYVEDASTHTEVKDPYYTWYNDEAVCRRILAEFGLPGASHIVNGHVPVREKNGESPIKGGGRLVVIDGGFCRAYHEKTGIAGYTLVYSSRTMSLRTHQPFESAEKAVKDNLDIISQKNILETENHRILVEDTDEGEVLRERVHDLKQLVAAYQLAGSLRLGAKTTSGKESATAMYLVFVKYLKKKSKFWNILRENGQNRK